MNFMAYAFHFLFIRIFYGQFPTAPCPIKIELSVTKRCVKMCPCPFFISLPLEKKGPFYCTILLLSALQHYRISCSKVLGRKGKWVSEESVLNDPSNCFYDVLWCFTFVKKFWNMKLLSFLRTLRFWENWRH